MGGATKDPEKKGANSGDGNDSISSEHHEESGADNNEEKPQDQAGGPGKSGNKANEIAMGNDDSDPDEDVMFERSNEDGEFSIWSVDNYCGEQLEQYNILLRALPEILVYLVVLLSLPLLAYMIAEKRLDLAHFFTTDHKKDDELERIMRRNLALFLSLAADSVFSVLTTSLLAITATIIVVLGLSKSIVCWAVAQSLYQKRMYARLSLSLLFAFYLQLKMYGKYTLPSITLTSQHDLLKTALLWGGVYAGMLFIVTVIVGVSTFSAKRSAFSDTIFNLNYKAYVFMKMKALSEAVRDGGGFDDIAADYLPDHDDGLFLLYRDAVFPSKEGARAYAKQTYDDLGKKELLVEDIRAFFPTDHKNIYRYLAGVSEKSDPTRRVRRSHYVSLAEQLYDSRKDIEKTLRGRESVFDKLEMIFFLAVTYLALILLLVLFQINAKVFMASVGTTLLTFSWIFADTIKGIFQCFVFLLIIRPFNIGDRVEVDGDPLTVHRMDLLTTTFLTPCKKILYISNTQLIGAKLYNIARSPAQSEILSIEVAEDTTYEQARMLESKAAEQFKKLKSFFTTCQFREITKLKLKYAILHTSNFQDCRLLRAKRNRIIKIFKQCMDEEVGIKHIDSFEFEN
ncbi:hypothetical protein PAPHI01_0182 [Pancytospora philotis]|nr:hypothetical protein PAPHI01_0182 [Pancytospora philotis]